MISSKYLNPAIEEQEELEVADEQQQEEEQPAIEQHEQQEEEEQPAIEQQQELEDIDMIRNIGKQKCSQMKSQIMVSTYSGDSQSIFVSSEDGTVYVFTASNLRLRCRINPTAYLPSDPSSRVYPLVIAAHPSESNQFGVGLSNGHVYVVEPSESEGTWGTSPPGSIDNFKSFA
ncbi:hypothetical protein F2Q68_00000248 [Brassica cretica]|uniref:Uncharacterized protein n=1 Tax=Brassica cretica TaxID=69181 RepID=A0A8S9J655_BRACR|nr:hypothetical protein F2Q68_00000248 [Brassica cretica]